MQFAACGWQMICQNMHVYLLLNCRLWLANDTRVYLLFKAPLACDIFVFSTSPWENPVYVRSCFRTARRFNFSKRPSVQSRPSTQLPSIRRLPNTYADLARQWATAEEEAALRQQPPRASAGTLGPLALMPRGRPLPAARTSTLAVAAASSVAAAHPAPVAATHPAPVAAQPTTSPP